MVDVMAVARVRWGGSQLHITHVLTSVTKREIIRTVLVAFSSARF